MYNGVLSKRNKNKNEGLCANSGPFTSIRAERCQKKSAST